MWSALRWRISMLTGCLKPPRRLLVTAPTSPRLNTILTFRENNLEIPHRILTSHSECPEIVFSLWIIVYWAEPLTIIRIIIHIASRNGFCTHRGEGMAGIYGWIKHWYKTPGTPWRLKNYINLKIKIKPWGGCLSHPHKIIFILIECAIPLTNDKISTTFIVV